MIPSLSISVWIAAEVYQRGLVIDSQLQELDFLGAVSVSKGIGD